MPRSYRRRNIMGPGGLDEGLGAAAAKTAAAVGGTFGKGARASASGT